MFGPCQIGGGFLIERERVMDEFSRPLSWREWVSVIASIVVTYPVLAGLLLVAGA